ncbi:oxidoreductase domain protein, partial [Paraphysoderma sedebokerense]
NSGNVYAKYALRNPSLCKVIAVAEPNEIRRKNFAQKHAIPQEKQYQDWKEIAALPKFADAVLITTLDHLHVEPAVAFANLKYHVLLEKPMAPSLKDCKAITDAIIKNRVSHVLRYSPYNVELKRLIDSGAIGDVISIQHLEPIGHWHFAHSYVRGNWRREDESCFSLMTKSCHDIDLISYFMNRKCKKISSFGSLTHFKKENKPAQAKNVSNCLDCSVQDSCPYSAKRVYLDSFMRGNRGWPVRYHIESLTTKLREGPYGRCVYESDNDVVDHQVVSMEFEGGKTANFSMVAFTGDICIRKTRIFGTSGELECNGSVIVHHDFSKKAINRSTPAFTSHDEIDGHGGGDDKIMKGFVEAVGGNIAGIKSGVIDSFESHLYVFAAEHSRRTGQTVDVERFNKTNGIITDYVN